jgi:O-antigen/teichoic acid export membrane protein
MPAISNAIWLSCSRVLADIASFLLFVAVARAFGPDGTGVYSYSFAIGSLLALAATSGFEEFGIREYVSSAAQARPGVWSNLISTQCAQLGIAVLLFAVFLVFDHGRSAPVTVMLELSVFQLAAGLARTLFVPAMAAQAMMAPAVLELSCRLTAIAVALGALWLPHPPPLAIALLSFPLSALLLVGLAWRNSHRHGPGAHIRLTWPVLYGTWRRTAPFAGSETLNQFYARADLLLIAYFLGNERVGLYATDIKFVEVGIVPLTLLGMAVYPVLSAIANGPAGAFALPARDFCRLQLMLSGWLAVGMTLLLPMLIVPLFGESFARAAQLLPWFALLAIIKGAEVALYRLLYCIHRPAVYLRSLIIGTVAITALNVVLVPRIGVVGAIQAAVVSTCAVVVFCARGMGTHLRGGVLVGLVSRLVFALALTWGLAQTAAYLGALPWLQAALGCAAYPALAAAAGLVPYPGRSPLFGRKHSAPGGMPTI